MRTLRSLPHPARLLALTLLLAACGDSNLIGPDNHLEATAATDQFQFQLSALDNVTDSRTFDWENTGTRATVDVSQSITSGSAILTVRDADGTVVHQEDIANGNDTTTSVGVAGTWSVEISLESVTGTFNFRLQKVT